MAAEGHRIAVRYTVSASKRPELVRKPQQGPASQEPPLAATARSGAAPSAGASRPAKNNTTSAAFQKAGRQGTSTEPPLMPTQPPPGP